MCFRKPFRYIRWRTDGTGPRNWLALFALFLLSGCELTEVQIEPISDLIVAGVTVTLAVDPLDPSRIDTHARALITRFHRQWEHEVPGASVEIRGEAGQALRLAEVSEPLVTCVTQLVDLVRPPAGSCHVASVSGTRFAPGERLRLTVTLPDGGVLTAESRMPGAFTPLGLSLQDSRCRLDPDTRHRFDWTLSDGSWGYIAEARFAGLGDLWASEYPLYLAATLRGADETGMLFPRDLLFELGGPNSTDVYRALHEGLPHGASAEVSVGAVDRNWINWTREGRINLDGEVLIPSVFGDGTGWFGTGVRWTLSVESREATPDAADDHLPLCGPQSG